MADWKTKIKIHYAKLLSDIDTKNGLQGELMKFPSSFRLQLIDRIWVIACNLDFFLIG